MTRTPAADAVGDKGKQRASTIYDGLNGSSFEAVAGETAGRPAMLSPETARLGDTHARTSRFLKKSKSKQQLKDTQGTSKSLQNSDGLPTKRSSIRTVASSEGAPEAANVSLPPSQLGSPVKQPPRSSTFSSPLASGGDKAGSYSPKKLIASDNGRSVGGWFSSMLSSSQNGQSTHNSNDDGASIRSFATVATSPSRLLQRKTASRDSPSRRSAFAYSINGSEGRTASVPNPGMARPNIAKIGGFERMFDRAMQFFTDSDSNADKCPDDIWLLGVKHQGWRPDNDHLSPSPSRSPGRRPSSDTVNSESYFRIYDASDNLPRPPSLSRQTPAPSRRRLSKSSNKTVSSKDASSPPSLELPSSPSRAKVGGLFKSRRGSADTSPSSHFLERSLSGSSSSSSAGRSEISSSRFSISPAVAEEPSGLPPTDDTASIYTFRTEQASSEQPQALPAPISSTQTYGWPPAFYHDFYSRLQLTYRSGFSPLQGGPPQGASNAVANAFSSMMTNLNASIGRSMSLANLGDTQPASGLSSDAGWGCMLRTGQSLLANALVDVHLGRDFRRPLPQILADSSVQSLFTSTSRYARYVRLISWFFDDPSPLSPFSIHRFAIEGKKLGKQIGEWFGPSTAAGAIKVLTNDFTPANLGVALAIDTTVYASEVAHVAQGDEPFGWNRPVLILVPLRLGLNGVNPIYFRSLQHYFTLPQCVGIAGGRPSSSYYFVGSQGQQLFYIDPHHTRPTVKSVNVPDHLQQKAQEEPLSRSTLPQTPDELAEPDSLSLFFANAYGPTELESFHSDKVRKMSLSALDPSMLVGLLCRSKEDWEDLCQRMQTFPKSKEHHQIINIVQEMPAWMRKSTRTISGAGLNASTSSQKGPARPLFSDNTCPKASAQLPQESEMLEDDSMEYADSEDWDIDDSEDDDMKSTEGSEKAEDLGNESIVIKPSSASFQEVFPGSFESDEPDYKASRKTRSPMANLQDLPSKLVVGTPGSAATAEDFERVSLDATTSPATESGEDRSAVLVLPPDLSHRDKPRMPDKRDMSLEVEDKEAGWESFNGRSTS